MTSAGDGAGASPDAAAMTVTARFPVPAGATVRSASPTERGRPSRFRISVVVVVRNERTTLPRLVEAIEAQTVPPTEVIIADGMSEDGTAEWVREAQKTRPWLKLVANPRRSIPGGLNVAIAHAQGDLVCRMDAHATFAPDYLAHVSRPFRSVVSVVGVGGAMLTKGYGPWGRAIAAVLKRPLGLGGAPHRVGGGGPVPHTFSPTYLRAAVMSVGGFDEAMRANEDFELDWRLRHAGGVIWLEPAANCTWFVRESYPALAKQMFRYGYFRARTLWLHPHSLAGRHLAPPALVLGVCVPAIIRPGRGWPLLGVYLAGAAAAGARAGRQDGASPLRAALVVPAVHIAWGTGLLVGLMRHWRASPSPAYGFANGRRRGDEGEE